MILGNFRDQSDHHHVNLTFDFWTQNQPKTRVYRVNHVY